MKRLIFKKRAKQPTEYQRLKKLHSILPVGSENAISKEHVALIWDMSERGARKLMTEVMRMYGLPVCNLGGGYFVPRNSFELKAYLDMHKNLKNTIQQGEYYIKNMLHNMQAKETQAGRVNTAEIAS